MNTSIELYELNRSIIEQQGVIKEEDIPRAMNDIEYLVCSANNQCYMLYGKEIGYFTLFMRDNYNWEIETLSLAVIECLANVGIVYSIELTANKDAVEIWVKDTEKDIITCMYLFPYDNGIVRIK
jgi:hypothetical protein